MSEEKLQLTASSGERMVRCYLFLKKMPAGVANDNIIRILVDN